MPRKNCLICNKIFYARPSFVQKGWGKYCSAQCKNEEQKKGRLVQCAYCRRRIYRSISQLKKPSKTGKYFCNKSCHCAWKNRKRNQTIKNTIKSVLRPLKLKVKKLKKKNHNLPSGKPTKKVLYKLYWQNNLPQDKIGQIFKVSHTTIQRWLSYYKIPIKSRTLSCGHNPNTLKNLELGRTEKAAKKSAKSRTFYSREKLIEKIKDFVQSEGRIPTKNEFVRNSSYPDYVTYRDYFGTWNNAIKAAGYIPNERWFFGEKIYAKDGHSCNSISEVIIDNWLFTNHIPHKREYLYPEGNYRCDFVVNGIFIEFFGLVNAPKVSSKYNQIISKKRKLCKKFRIPLIELFEKDLYNLDLSLGGKLKKTKNPTTKLFSSYLSKFRTKIYY